MSSMTVVVPIMGGLIESKPYWGALLSSVAGPCNLMIIDNAPEADQGALEFFHTYIASRWPGLTTYHPQPDNLGVVRSLQFAYQNTTSDLLAFLHNDIYVYEYGWDQIFCQFTDQEDNNVGLIGFFGAKGVAKNSGRFYVYNNMLEAEIHGNRTNEIQEVAVLDGLCMVASRKMLEARDGVDCGYDVHHFYDLDLSLESLDRGFRNWVIPVFCHHQSGVTACRPLFNNWANEYMEGGQDAIYNKNKDRFISKWQERLPYEVGRGWSG